MQTTEDLNTNGPLPQTLSPLPDWYLSSKGPQISQTIISISANVLPVLNLVLASKGINILPESVNTYVTMGVFAFFSIRAAVGYIRAKKVLGNRVRVLNEQVRALGGRIYP